MAHLPQDLPFQFPTDSPHAGMPLSNVNFAALVWADDTHFHLTLNRQDYWNRQGEILWGPKASGTRKGNVLETDLTPADSL